MSIAGELTIRISGVDDAIKSQITSTRPLHASRLFTGKSIPQTLQTLPLLFSICSKAQAVTAIRAIESATQSPAHRHIESIREALIKLENLREQTLRVIMDWPSSIHEKAENPLLSHVSLGINQLMQSLDPKQVLTYKSDAFAPKDTPANTSQWQSFSHTLSQSIFGSSAQCWLDHISQEQTLENWASKKQTQTARFIHWLNGKDWKHAGSSSIKHIPKINDEDLASHLSKQNQTFTTHPTWKNQCYELSWYSRKHSVENEPGNNGIYHRLTARLKEIADLILQLDCFFLKSIDYTACSSPIAGIAHSEAARGRLTHYVEIENDTINKLVILAPTEWNFHPNGVAVDSLNHLNARSRNELRQQAELLIHAIDPCVDYQLNITE